MSCSRDSQQSGKVFEEKWEKTVPVVEGGEVKWVELYLSEIAAATGASLSRVTKVRSAVD